MKEKIEGVLKGLTLRAVLIGIACVVFLSVATPFCDMVLRSTWIGSTYLPIGAISIFFVLVLGLNLILKLLKIGLSSTELLLIYCMMIFGAGIPSFGLVVFLIPVITAPFYFATPENHWAEIQKIMPKWMAPQDPDAIKYLYEGLPKGMKIPWGPWIKPLLFWTMLVFALYLIMFCLSVILRKQWVENEKLVFPLAYLPVEMVKVEEGGIPAIVPSFFKNKIMWIFFLVPVIIYSVKGLHFYFPMIPDVNLVVPLDRYFVEKPWNSIQWMWIRVFFSAIGFVYLLPTQLSFSLWFFYFFFLFQILIGAVMGLPMPMIHGYPCRQFCAYQMAGGTLAFSILTLWAMREHLRDIFRKAFKNTGVDDSNEPSTYRFALIGLLLGIILVSFWGMMAGTSFWFMFITCILSILILLAMTRLVSEGGMFYIQQQFRPSDIIMPFTGSAALGPSNLMVGIFFEQIFIRDMRATLMPFLMDAFKISDSGKLKKRSLTLVMIISVAVAIFVSYWAFLRFMYQYGGINLEQYFTIGYNGSVTTGRVSSLLGNPQPANGMNIVSMGIGAVVMMFLLWMRRIFLWWPFHPLGYIMGNSWPMIQLWFSVFIAWLIKVFVLKFGGIKIYRKLIPGFLGLILGEFLILGIWALIDFFCGVKGHQIMFL